MSLPLVCGVLSLLTFNRRNGLVAAANEANTKQCALYIAESTVVGKNGPKLGLFSGIDYIGETTIGIEELVVPMKIPNTNEYSPWHEARWNHDAIRQSHTTTSSRADDNALGDLPAIYDDPTEYRHFLLSGLGSLTSCGGPVELVNGESIDEIPYNVLYNSMKRPYRLEDESADDATRTTSNFINYGFVTTKYGVEAGEELFINCDLNGPPRRDTPEGVQPEKVLRRLEWIQRYGTCIDNIMVQPSKSVSNERGAFAKRTMPAGAIVSISPVIHMDRSQIDIVHQQPYDPIEPIIPLIRSHGIQYNNTIVLGQQLLKNYVFGHSDSNLLLFPVAPGVNFINHNHLNPNIGIRWSNMPHSTEELRNNTTVMRLLEMDPFILVMEYYALRDIKEGEELAMDYGPEWRQAWEEYDAKGKGQMKKPFRYEIGVPDGFYPRNWLRTDPNPYGDFIGNPLAPNHMAPVRWKHNAEVVTPWAFRIGVPTSVRQVLLEYCNKMGITDIFKHVTVEGNELEPGTETYIQLEGEDWFLQRPESKWRSNLHWFSPGDSPAHEHYLQALSVAGFDSVLNGIGQYLGMDGLVAFHVTFIGVSWSTEGFLHADVRKTGAKVYNIIVPLILVNETGPELDLQSGLDEPEPNNNVIGRYRYEYDIAGMMGDFAMHATSSVDYRPKKAMRMAATIYIADVNDHNVDSILNYYTQAFPPSDPELLKSWAGRHWKKDDPTKKLPAPPADHILVRTGVAQKYSGASSSSSSTTNNSSSSAGNSSTMDSDPKLVRLDNIQRPLVVETAVDEL